MHNNIKKHNPFERVLNDVFGRSISDIVGTDFTHSVPGVNIIDLDDKMLLEMAAPGLEKSDFDVSIEKDILSIAVKKEASSEGNDTIKVTRKEYDFHSFTRKFSIPSTLDKDTLTAKYEYGILLLSINKTKEAVDKSPRSIEIG